LFVRELARVLAQHGGSGTAVGALTVGARS